MIKYRIGGITTEVELKQFKDGCMNVNINKGSAHECREHKDIIITAVFGDEKVTGYSINDMIFALGLTVDALKRHYPYSTLSLNMPYAPYARQDRPCSPGEAFSARFAADVINGMGFARVVVVDPHSAVLAGLYKNLYYVSQFDVFKNIYLTWNDVWVVAPDAGAMKKCEEFADRVGAAGVLACAKKRDMKTIDILQYRMIDDIPLIAEKFLILDDILDGGRTFVHCVNAIEEAAPGDIVRIDLAVTHGLFTFGTDVAKSFDTVYTTNSYNSVKDASNIEIVNIF